jgi:hypothetical protein
MSLSSHVMRHCQGVIDRDAMSLPSHIGDGAAEATLVMA